MFKNFNLMDQVNGMWTFDRTLSSQEKADLSEYFNTVGGIDEIISHLTPNNAETRADAIRSILGTNTDHYAKKYIAFVVSKLIEQCRTL